MRHETQDGFFSNHTAPSLPIFSPSHFSELSKNEYMRYYPSADVSAHVVIEKNSGMAMQYRLPDSATDAPFVAELQALTQITLSENKAMITGTYHRSSFVSRRSYSFSIQTEGQDPVFYDYYPLSPTKNRSTGEERSIVYDPGSIERCNNTTEARTKFQTTTPRIKEGDWLLIKNTDVPLRMASTRTPDQNTVMGQHHIQIHPQEIRGRKQRSAKEEVTESLEKNRRYFSADMQNALEKMANAPFRCHQAKDPQHFSAEKQSYPEWLHRESHNLHPMDKDPQRADNLGAAEMRYNTAMMLGERTMQFFALHNPSSKNKLKGRFAMLLDTEIIDRIWLITCLQVGKTTVTLTQEIDTFPKEPQNNKPSDLAAFIGILHCMIQNISPQSRQSMVQASITPRIQRHRFIGNTAPQILLDDSSDDELTLKN